MTSLAPSSTQERPPVDMVDLERRITKARSLLIVDHPFFASTVCKRPLKWDESIPTACINAAGLIRFNPYFANGLKVKQLIFLFAHEALHYMLLHPHRMKNRQAEAWNIACDKVINDTLIAERVGEFIEGGVTMDGARELSAEELYSPETGEGGGEGGNGGIGDDLSPGTTHGDGTPMSEAEIEQAATEAMIEALQAMETAKSMGKMPGSMARMIEKMIAVTTPWHEILERYMMQKVPDNTSWKRPNRRFMSQGLYLPGVDTTVRMGTVVIGVDTSGSITEKELAVFGGHINRIMEACKPEKVVVMYCDARLNHTDEYEMDDLPIVLKPYGGGGTSFKPVIEAANDIEDVEVLVYLTDGCGDQNNIKQPDYDVVWLTTHEKRFPWGDVIEFKG